MDHSCGNLEVSNSDRNIESKSPAHEVSERSKDSIKTLVGDCFCDTLTKNLTVFCSCPENLQEAELKGSGLIPFVEEISIYHNIEFGDGYY